MIPSKFKGPLVKEKMRKLSTGDRAMIRMIQGSIHVSKSNMYVARYWLKRTQGFGPYKVHSSKCLRFAIAREGLKCYHSNQDIYHQAMGGGRWQAIDKRKGGNKC